MIVYEPVWGWLWPPIFKILVWRQKNWSTNIHLIERWPPNKWKGHSDTEFNFRCYSFDTAPTFLPQGVIRQCGKDFSQRSEDKSVVSGTISSIFCWIHSSWAPRYRRMLKKTCYADYWNVKYSSVKVTIFIYIIIADSYVLFLKWYGLEYIVRSSCLIMRYWRANKNQ